jgi:hypothetical protein
MNTITIHTQNKFDLDLFKSLAQRLNAVVEEKETEYDPEFVAKIRRAEKSESIELTPELQRELFGL